MNPLRDLSQPLPVHIRAAMERKPALSQPSYEHNSTRAKIPNAAPDERPPALDGHHAGKAQGPRLPHVRFVLRRVRLLDIDAKYTSVKDLLDGLSKAGLVDGDQEDQITLEVRQEKVRKFRDEETVIEIETP